MKKVFLSMLALAALSACSNDDNNVNDGPVPIRLGSGIDMEVVSKAPIDPAKNTQFTASIVGWEAEQEPTSFTGESKEWQTTITTTASVDAKDVPTWGTTQFYNQDEDINTYMIAWHPEGTLTGTNVSFENDGTKDAMVAEVVSGNKETTTDPVLDFKHLSAQIVFKVKTENEDVVVSDLQSITINNVNVVTGINLADYSATSTQKNVSVSISENLVINSTEAVVAGDGVMITPDRKNITITVVADNVTYENQAVTLSSANIEAGKSYIITLTFKRQGITVDAKVQAWQPGNQTGDEGNVDLI